MKHTFRRYSSLSLLACIPLAAAADRPMVVRLTNAAPFDMQLADLVRSNNRCIEQLTSGDNGVIATACRMSMTRAEAMTDSTPEWPSSNIALGATTLAAVYSNVALAHWKAGNQQRAEKLLAMADEIAPEAAFVARNRLLIATPE